jgi:peptidoglycan/LPS O-acetylase OafA/YrhL
MMRENNFTLVRLILATMVVFGHFKVLPGLSRANYVYGYADFAVDAFFIVSGFLVYGSFDNLPKVKSFYIKRFFRIYPLYFVVIIVQALAMILILGNNAQLSDIIKYLASNLIYLNFISPDIGGLLAQQNNKAINPSLWTLKIEVMFYMLVPVIWYLIKRIGVVTIPLIYIASTIYTLVAISHGYETLAKQLPGQLRFFVTGIALYIYRDKLMLSRPLAFVSAILLFAVCSIRHIDFITPVYPLVVGSLVFICVLRLPVIKMKLDMSYGVYLIHAPLIQLAVLLGIFNDSFWFLCLLLVFVYALAYLVEKLIEVPMVDYGKKLAARFSRPSLPDAA